MADLSYDQMMQMYQSMNQTAPQQTPTVNQAASNEQTAASIIKPVTGMMGAIPIAGPIIAGVGSLVSMGLQMDAAGKQKSQAEADLKAAKNMKPAPLPKEFMDKARADKFAAGSNAPGLEQANDALANDFAQHLRAIHNNSRNGGQAAHAIATALGFNNESMAKLYATNMAYKAKAGETARQDLWDIGLKKQGAEQTLFENYQKPLFQQATALQNASTANRVAGASGLANAISTIGSSAMKLGAFEQMLQGYTSPAETTANEAVSPTSSVKPETMDFSKPTMDWGLGSNATIPELDMAPSLQTVNDSNYNTPVNNAGFWQY